MRSRSRGVASVEKSIENTATVEIGKLERGLNLLSNLGNLAPLLGFFGTVVGMRHSFLQFVVKAAPTAKDLAGGVEEALITTQAGLLIAIPTYLVYNLFLYSIDTVTIELERCANELSDRLS
jgi:biopolymer transport protein ExbB